MRCEARWHRRLAGVLAAPAAERMRTHLHCFMPLPTLVARDCFDSVPSDPYPLRTEHRSRSSGKVRRELRGR